MLHRLLDFVSLEYLAVQTFSPLQIYNFKVSTNTVLHNTLGWWNHLHQKQHNIAFPLADLTKRTLPLLKMSIIKDGRSKTLPLASPAAFDLQGQRDLTTWLFIVGSGWISGTPKSSLFLQAHRYSSWQEAEICLLRRNPVKVNPNRTPCSRCAETPWSLTHGHAHIQPRLRPAAAHPCTHSKRKVQFQSFCSSSDCISSHILTQMATSCNILIWTNDAKQIYHYLL